MASFQLTHHDICSQRALNVKAAFNMKTDTSGARQSGTRKGDIRCRFQFPQYSKKNDVCTHLGFMLGGDGSREWGKKERLDRRERMDAEGKGEERRSRTERRRKIRMLRRGVWCVTAVRERVEVLCFFLRLSLAATIINKRDQTQPRPRQAWLFAIFPGLTHAALNLPVFKEKMGSRLSNPRYCIGKKCYN